MSNTTPGKIVNTVSLYSEECLVLLRKALEAGQAHSIGTTSEPTSTARKSRYADSSTDGSVAPQDEASSEDSSDGEEEAEDTAKPVTVTSTTALPPSLPSIQERDRPARRKKNKVEMDQRQREILIRKHVDSLSCFSFPAASVGALRLELPSSLLSKDDRLAHNVSTQCQSYCSLASQLIKGKPVVVLFLRSGRFAGAVFVGAECVAHRAFTRYTVRKGQGKSQSSQDGQRKAQSMGAQLRRAGEQGLREDVASTLLEWKQYLDSAALLLLSCPKTMKKSLFDGSMEYLRDDPRIRRVPLDLGRPTFDNACLIHSVMMTVTVRELDTLVQDLADRLKNQDVTSPVDSDSTKRIEKVVVVEEKEEEENILPMTPVHEAARDSDVEKLESLLEAAPDKVDTLAGPDYMTPLHYAAQSTEDGDPVKGAECVVLLLEQFGANPCIVDIRNRVPYFLATHEKLREAFRMSRAALGEEYCRWDEDAKVGPPLTDEHLQRKKEKEAEKKRRKKARQKEKKAKEKAQAEEAERLRIEQEEQQKQAEEAKRARDGLQPKQRAAGNVCDYCQTVCSGRKRNQMFKRLEYSYCSTECVQKHKRELMAAAALSRLGG